MAKHKRPLHLTGLTTVSAELVTTLQANPDVRLRQSLKKSPESMRCQHWRLDKR